MRAWIPCSWGAFVLVAGTLVAGTLGAGCDCTGGASGASVGPCDSEAPPATCGQSCGEDTPCPAGFYCGADESCTAECNAGTNTGCVSGQTCSAAGRCVSSGRDASFDAPTICADVMLEARPVTPTVMLIIDQSGSMTADFGRSNRWDVLKDSLMGMPDGFVYALQSQVEFGLALYSARAEGDGPVMGECPIITSVAPAMDNYGPIRAVYGPASPIDETPTGDAVDAVLAELRDVPDPDPDPTIFILATDGEPDRCEEPNPQRGQAEAVGAVERAHDAGVRTFIISVGEEISEGHLQDVANAGLGRGPGDPDADFWVAGDDTGLRDALRAIIGGALSCRVELRGRIDTDMACAGSVELNGRSLPCDDPHGWEVIDDNTIELLGDACDELLSTSGATLLASFPCDVVLI